MNSFAALEWQWQMGATDFVAAQPRVWQRAERQERKKQEGRVQDDPQNVPILPLAQLASFDLSNVTTLPALRAAIENFDGLPIKKTATQIVFGEGPANPRVVWIGDAPSADDDKIGRPFMGESGQLLDKMLAAIGMARTTDSYLTNLVHWCPPASRAVTPQEATVSLPFVRRHIALLKPEFIVTMGGIVSKTLLDVNEGITRVRGQWRDYGCETGRIIPALMMFHPAYLLRTPAQKALAWQDLKALQARLGAHLNSETATDKNQASTTQQ